MDGVLVGGVQPIVVGRGQGMHHPIAKHVLSKYYDRNINKAKTGGFVKCVSY